MKDVASQLRTVCVGDSLGLSRKERHDRQMSEMKVKDGNVQTTSIHAPERTYPETGRKSICIGRHVQQFDGMTGGGEPAANRFFHETVDPT